MEISRSALTFPYFHDLFFHEASLVSDIEPAKKTSGKNVLFVAAQIGQMKQAQALAKHLGLAEIDIAILYTRKNLDMPARMEQDANYQIVKQVHKVEIHPASNEISYIAAKFDHKKYSDLLDRVKPARLFVCSFERHYAVLCREAKKRGIPISLYEEGTAILKLGVPGYQSFHAPTLERSANTIYKRVWKDQPITKYVFKPIIIAIWQIITLPKLILRTLREVYKTPQVQRPMVEKNEPEFLTGWHYFEEVYSSHPNVVAAFFPGATPKEFHPDHSKPEDAAIALHHIAEYGIDQNTAIFASQKFDLQPERQIPVVLQILAQLADITGYRIAIKLHPRESEKIKSLYRTSMLAFQGNPEMVLIEGEHVPAEALIANSASPAVIGISSSTLMYAPHSRVGIRAISIGQQLLKDLARLKIDNAGTRQIRDHVEILNALPHIEHFDIEEARRNAAR